jgi:hypothetical protein
MSELVDLDNLTTQQVYTILQHTCKFDVGQKVLYSQRGALDRECVIENIAVQYGKVTYGNSLSKWGYEDQYKLASAEVVAIAEGGK